MQLEYAENCRFATNAIITSPTEKMFSNDREIASGNRSKRNSATLVHVSATLPRVALGSNYYRYTDTRSSTNYPPTFKPGREKEREGGEKRSFRVGTRATARGILRAHVNGRKAKRSSNVTRVSTVYSVKLSVHRP